MSGDEMVFEEVSFREPQRLRRPDREPRLASLAYGLPGPDDLPIFLDRGPADAIERHALRDTSVELGGILLGKECVDEETDRPFVWVTQAIEAKHYENTQASFTYTHDSWEEITRERDKQFPDLDIVGWYHTHPDFGIFLSGHDLFIHRNFFDRPLQVAYVVDPIRQDRGFFQWRADRVDQVGGCQVTCERAERVATARLLNNLEKLPDQEPGGGMSPRLEAELIAMLSRPHTYAPAPSSSAERLQLATLFTMLGTAAGVLAAAGGLWLYALNNSVARQTDEIVGLRESLAKASEKHKGEVDLARVHAKEAALDSLLREVRPGASPEVFTELYAKTLRERDEAQRDLAQQKALIDNAGSSLVKYQSESKNLRASLEDAQKKLDALEVDARELGRIKDDKAKLEAQVKKLEAQASEQGEELLTLKDVQSGKLPRNYQIAWYAAVAGWGLAILLGLGILAMGGRAQDEPTTPPGTPA
ncbi:MAG: Mov34/MPN/PAD-1 family protein [Isosphaeraceae bacterium]